MPAFFLDWRDTLILIGLEGGGTWRADIERIACNIVRRSKTRKISSLNDREYIRSARSPATIDYASRRPQVIS